jgi:hypothetical protein
MYISINNRGYEEGVAMGSPKYAFRGVVLIVGFIITLQISLADGREVIDLVEGKINGFLLFDLTLDKITELYGRPTAIYPQVDKTEHGPVLDYYNKGLSFMFYHSKYDKEQHCIGMSIGLVKEWDKKRNIWTVPYAGEIRRNVTANWRVKDVMDKFSDCKMVDLYDHKKAAELKEQFKDDEDLVKRLMAAYTKMVAIPPRHKHHIIFLYEETTKFIESVGILEDPTSILNKMGKK